MRSLSHSLPLVCCALVVLLYTTELTVQAVTDFYITTVESTTELILPLDADRNALTKLCSTVGGVPAHIRSQEDQARLVTVVGSAYERVYLGGWFDVSAMEWVWMTGNWSEPTSGDLDAFSDVAGNSINGSFVSWADTYPTDDMFGGQFASPFLFYFPEVHGWVNDDGIAASYAVVCEVVCTAQNMTDWGCGSTRAPPTSSKAPSTAKPTKPALAIPRWAIAVIVVGGMIVIAVIIVIIVCCVRRGRRPEQPKRVGDTVSPNGSLETDPHLHEDTLQEAGRHPDATADEAEAVVIRPAKEEDVAYTAAENDGVRYESVVVDNRSFDPVAAQHVDGGEDATTRVAIEAQDEPHHHHHRTRSFDVGDGDGGVAAPLSAAEEVNAIASPQAAFAPPETAAVITPTDAAEQVAEDSALPALLAPHGSSAIDNLEVFGTPAQARQVYRGRPFHTVPTTPPPLQKAEEVAPSPPPPSAMVTREPSRSSSGSSGEDEEADEHYTLFRENRAVDHAASAASGVPQSDEAEQLAPATDAADRPGETSEAATPNAEEAGAAPAAGEGSEAPAGTAETDAAASPAEPSLKRGSRRHRGGASPSGRKADDVRTSNMSNPFDGLIDVSRSRRRRGGQGQLPESHRSEKSTSIAVDSSDEESEEEEDETPNRNDGEAQQQAVEAKGMGSGSPPESSRDPAEAQDNPQEVREGTQQATADGGEQAETASPPPQEQQQQPVSSSRRRRQKGERGRGSSTRRVRRNVYVHRRDVPTIVIHEPSDSEGDSDSRPGSSDRSVYSRSRGASCINESGAQSLVGLPSTLCEPEVPKETDGEDGSPHQREVPAPAEATQNEEAAEVLPPPPNPFELDSTLACRNRNLAPRSQSPPQVQIPAVPQLHRPGAAPAEPAPMANGPERTASDNKEHPHEEKEGDHLYEEQLMASQRPEGTDPAQGVAGTAVSAYNVAEMYREENQSHGDSDENSVSVLEELYPVCRQNTD